MLFFVFITKSLTAARCVRVIKIILIIFSSKLFFNDISRKHFAIVINKKLLKTKNDFIFFRMYFSLIFVSNKFKN